MKYLFLLIMVIYNACSSHRPFIKDAIIERNIFEKNIKKKYGFSIAGDGGAYLDCIEELSVTFKTHHQLSIENLRFIIVGMYLEFLDQLNRNEKIKPYVKGNEFVPRNLDLSIMCMKPDGEFQELAGVMFKNDKFFYKTENPKTQLLENYYIETWEEALAIYMKALNQTQARCGN